MQWDCSVYNLAHLRENSSELGLRAVITKHNIKVNRKYSGYTNFASLFYSYILLLLYPYNGPPVIKINSPAPWKKTFEYNSGYRREPCKKKNENLLISPPRCTRFHCENEQKHRTRTSHFRFSFSEFCHSRTDLLSRLCVEERKDFFFNKSSRMIRKFGSIGGESIF